jgi:hypothetical protein
MIADCVASPPSIIHLALAWLTMPACFAVWYLIMRFAGDPAER